MQYNTKYLIDLQKNKDNNYTFIYSLEDPMTHEIRYIGKTNNPYDRYKAHKNISRDKNTHKRNWINKLRINGLHPIMNIIDVVKIDEWGFWEKYWIQQFNVWGFNLLNYTDGGEGLTFGNKTSFKKGNIGWNKGKGIKKYCMECGEPIQIRKNNKFFCSLKCFSIYSKKYPNKGTFKKGCDLKSKTVLQLDLNSNIINEFKNAIDASLFVKCSPENIRNVCNGRSKTAKKYKWKYKYGK